jgi:hypothetical protein
MTMLIGTRWIEVKIQKAKTTSSMRTSRISRAKRSRRAKKKGRRTKRIGRSKGKVGNDKIECMLLMEVLALLHRSLHSIVIRSDVYLLGSLADINELGLEGSSSDEETVNVGLFAQLLAVLSVDTSSVDDPGLVGNGGGDLLTQPFTEGGVDFLGLLRGLS